MGACSKHDQARNSNKLEAEGAWNPEVPSLWPTPTSQSPCLKASQTPPPSGVPVFRHEAMGTCHTPTINSNQVPYARHSERGLGFPSVRCWKLLILRPGAAPEDGGVAADEG